MTSKFVFLMHKASGTSGTYTKLVDIKDFPDLFPEPEALDATTLSDYMRKFEKGIIENTQLSVTAPYTKDNFSAIQDLEDSQELYAIWFGGTESGGVVTPTGSDGKFEFTADIHATINGGGVNQIVDMGITLYPSTMIVFS